MGETEKCQEMSQAPTQPSINHNTHVISLGACLDVSAEHALESAVCQVQERQGQHIILNLQALRNIDSRGLGKLFLTYHHLSRNKIRLSFVNPGPNVREMLEFVNFPQIVPIYDSMDDLIPKGHTLVESSSFPPAVV